MHCEYAQAISSNQNRTWKITVGIWLANFVISEGSLQLSLDEASDKIHPHHDKLACVYVYLFYNNGIWTILPWFSSWILHMWRFPKWLIQPSLHINKFSIFRPKTSFHLGPIVCFVQSQNIPSTSGPTVVVLLKQNLSCSVCFTYWDYTVYMSWITLAILADTIKSHEVYTINESL